MSSLALLKVASGERRIVYGILLLIASPILKLAIGGSAAGSAFIAVCFFIPVIGFIAWLVVMTQGLKARRIGGVKVDLLGVWRRTIKSPDSR